MRDRWQTVSHLWEEKKTAATTMDLLGQLDYYGKLSAQLDWQRNPGGRPVRVVYGGWGTPTAALLHDDDAIVDYKLFWIACKDTREANYLLAIINSDALFEKVTPLMSKGQFGARDLQKHLWKLPIPEFDAGNPLHVAVSEAGRVVAEGAVQQLERLRYERGRVTVTVARREIRKWLRESDEGKAVEERVDETVVRLGGCRQDGRIEYGKIKRRLMQRQVQVAVLTAIVILALVVVSFVLLDIAKIKDEVGIVQSVITSVAILVGGAFRHLQISAIQRL